MSTKDQIWHEGSLKDTVLRDVCFDGNTLTVTGDNGCIANSLNQGVNFARAVSGFEAPDHVFSVASDGKGTLAAGSRFGGITVSKNYGIEWDVYLKGVKQENPHTLKDCAFGNGKFIFLDDLGGLKIFDLERNIIKDSAPMIKSPDCIAFIKGMFYIGGGVNQIWRGDGTGTWEACQWEKTKIDFRGCRAIGYSASLGLYFCAGHEIAVSTNGKVWRAIYDLHATPAGNRNIHSMLEVKNQMLFGGEDCMTILYDGKNFQQLGPLGNRAILSMALVNDVIIGVGPAGVRHLHLTDIPDSTTPPKPQPPEPPEPGDKDAQVIAYLDKCIADLNAAKALVAGK